MTRQPIGTGPDQRYWRRRANRRVRKARLTRSLLYWSGIVATELVIAGVIVFAGVRIVDNLTSTPEFALEHIEIEGNRMASVPAIKQRLDPYLGRSLLDLDLDRVVALANQDPWTRSVSAKRILPGTLRLRIHERTPCALARIGDQVYVVDTTGYVVGRADVDTAALPLLTGLDGLSNDALIGALSYGTRIVQLLNDQAAAWVPEIAELDLARRDRISVRTIDPGPTLLLDRHRVTRNLDEYLELRREIVRRFGSIDYVDLRWQDRISVRPKDNDQERQVRNG